MPKIIWCPSNLLFFAFFLKYFFSFCFKTLLGHFLEIIIKNVHKYRVNILVKALAMPSFVPEGIANAGHFDPKALPMPSFLPEMVNFHLL